MGTSALTWGKVYQFIYKFTSILPHNKFVVFAMFLVLCAVIVNSRSISVRLTIRHTVWWMFEVSVTTATHNWYH